MQSAAGAPSQRLKPVFAIVCSRSRIPPPPLEILPAFSTVAINHSSPRAARAGLVTCRGFPDTFKHSACCPLSDGKRRNLKKQIWNSTPGKVGYAAPVALPDLPGYATHRRVSYYRHRPGPASIERPIGAEAGRCVDWPKVAISAPAVIPEDASFRAHDPALTNANLLLFPAAGSPFRSGTRSAAPRLR